MATPLATLANARIYWEAPGTRSTGRDGYAVQPGQAYLLRAFLERKSDPQTLSLPALAGAEFALKGYLINYAPLTTILAPTWETIGPSTLTLVETGLAPTNLRRSEKVQVLINGMGRMDAKVVFIGTAYGNDGIGAIIRDKLGDPILLAAGQIG